MEIRFIGTCAASFSKRLETDLKHTLDKDARRSSSVLVDGHLLIDCGPHTVESLLIQNIVLSEIDTIILTHLHADHYQPDSIKEIAMAAERELTLGVHNDALPFVQEMFKDTNIEVFGFTYCEQKSIANGLDITPLPANHSGFACHYLIEKNGKSMYYATDGAWIMFDAFYHLKNKKLDMFVVDATVGDYEGDYRVAEHNSIPMVRLMIKSFDKFQICDSHTKIYLTHLAPSLHKSHDETVAIMKKDKIDVAYDGLVVNIE